MPNDKRLISNPMTHDNFPTKDVFVMRCSLPKPISSQNTVYNFSSSFAKRRSWGSTRRAHTTMAISARVAGGSSLTPSISSGTRKRKIHTNARSVKNLFAKRRIWRSMRKGNTRKPKITIVASVARALLQRIISSSIMFTSARLILMEEITLTQTMSLR